MRVVLPHGLWSGGTCLREVEIRPLRGRDEAVLAEQDSGSPAERVTELLGRCVLEPAGVRLGADAARSLTVGDREALVLNLRRVTFGERMPCVLACPDPGCAERLDLDLSAGDLLVDPYPASRARYDVRIGPYDVTFRLPTGVDQEVAAPAAFDDPARAVDIVLRRCVEAVRGPTLVETSIPREVAEGLPAIMASLDPQAELRLDVACPACGTPFDVAFDTAQYLFQELAINADALDREVHTLALHYHWSESQILALAHRKRRRYLELIADAVGAGTRT